MEQEASHRDQNTILILGTVQSLQANFFSRIHLFSLLRIIDKDENIIFNIPAWPKLVVLFAFF